MVCHMTNLVTRLIFNADWEFRMMYQRMRREKVTERGKCTCIHGATFFIRKRQITRPVVLKAEATSSMENRERVPIEMGPRECQPNFHIQGQE